MYTGKLFDGYNINVEDKNISSFNSYPHSLDYDFETYIEFIDFDKERENDILNGRGFIIEPSQKSMKKDLVADNGIYSPKFGQTLKDLNPYIDRYKCKCGQLRGRIHSGIKCPNCGEVCKFVDDDFGYFGWCVLDEPYHIIHPAFYKKLDSFFGKGVSVKGMKRSKLENMINAGDILEKDKCIKTPKQEKDEPFFAIGMIDFYNRFDEIMEYYYTSSRSSKANYYNDIYNHRDKVFTHSLPVFTTLLRPINIDGGKMTYEETNAIYSKINASVTSINNSKTTMAKIPRIKNKHLYNLQTRFMDLYNELEKILSGKKGDFRCLLGGRYTFTSRNVIVQNPDLRIDEVTLPVLGLCILLEQRIKNILSRLYNMQPADAHREWRKAIDSKQPNDMIKGIIQSIIDEYRSKGMRGIPVIINRNPTISYGSILSMYCVGFTDTYTMGVPVQPLPLLVADFDGDVLNILLPINMTFIKHAWAKFNPRNSMYISRNDGYFNPAVSMQRDTLINLNTLARLGRSSYTEKELKIKQWS